MKLMYDLPSADAKVFEEAKTGSERLMYCLPFNMHEDKFVLGYIAITDRFIYKILDGVLLEKYELSRMKDVFTSLPTMKSPYVEEAKLEEITMHSIM